MTRVLITGGTGYLGSDLAHAHVLALERSLGGGGQSAALNLASGNSVSVRQVVPMARGLTRSKINMQYCDSRPVILLF